MLLVGTKGIATRNSQQSEERSRRNERDLKRLTGDTACEQKSKITNLAMASNLLAMASNTRILVRSSPKSTKRKNRKNSDFFPFSNGFLLLVVRHLLLLAMHLLLVASFLPNKLCLKVSH